MKIIRVLLPFCLITTGICFWSTPKLESQIINHTVTKQDSFKLIKVDPEIEKKWTIGIYTGSSPFKLTSPSDIKNPVLTAEDVTDLKVDIVAHPFLIKKDSMYYLYFTAKDGKTDKGGIGLAESKNGIDWKYRQIVILEPFVLSYPCVFKWDGDYYMIPEAHTETSLRLYKATEFPRKWKYERDLLTGDTFISSTIVRYNNIWWLFIAKSGNETSRLFYSSDLKGNWTEHPMSPIVKNDLDIARPAGRPFIIDGILYRLGQDCFPTYGNQVHAFQIMDITTKIYKEKMVEAPLIRATSSGWNSDAMHHIDAIQIAKNKWIAAVDALGNYP